MVPRVAEKREQRKGPPLPIEVIPEKGIVRVLRKKLPYNAEGGEKVPSMNKFIEYTLDERTIEICEMIAQAVANGQPLMLEGETGTSKTSTIEYMAAMANVNFIRINMSQSTEISDLVGRYVPNSKQVIGSLKDALQNIDTLQKGSRAIIDRARLEDRELTTFELHKIAQIEDIHPSEWAWLDSVLVKALKKGNSWVVLDEANLADTQVIERINSLLERFPSLTISEHENESFTPRYRDEKGQWVDNGFRIFVAMNPDKYGGRSAWSKALQNRFVLRMKVDEPNRQQYEQQMKLAIYGKSPEIQRRGVHFRAKDRKPQFDNLRHISGMRSFIYRFASFQAELEELCNKREIGRASKVPYSFTRRNFIAFLSVLNDWSEVDPITGKDVSYIRKTQNGSGKPGVLIDKSLLTSAVEDLFEVYYLKSIAVDDRETVSNLLELNGLKGADPFKKVRATK